MTDFFENTFMIEGSMGASSEVTDPLVLHLSPEPFSLDVVAEAIEVLAREGHWCDKDRYHVDLVLEELLQNIISYGFPDGRSGGIDLTIHQTQSEILIRLEDDGVAFDPFSVSDPDLEAPLDERAIGGLGVYFARTFMDASRYIRVNGRNCVELHKRLASATPDGS